MPLLRERHSAPASSAPDGHGDDRGNPTGDAPEGNADNPFAPPPEGRPDQEWRPRASGDGDAGGDGNGDDSRRQSRGGNRWSSRQPGRQGGGFGLGQRPGGVGGGSEGPGGPGGMRWDPTDPNQRRARYALLSGMWGFFFALFNLPEIALLLGALAIYWGTSSLRGKAPQDDAGTRTALARPSDVSGAPAEDSTPAAGPGRGAEAAPGKGMASGAGQGSRPQTTSAVSGVVTGSIALAIVAATFTFQIVYQDYYTCVDDALTRPSQQSCEQHLPERLRPLLTTEE